jgi:hypothetical protein
MSRAVMGSRVPGISQGTGGGSGAPSPSGMGATARHHRKSPNALNWQSVTSHFHQGKFENKSKSILTKSRSDLFPKKNQRKTPL